MTRINLIDPSLLCDEHLRAEHREMTRIPNMILKGKYTITDPSKIPAKYTVRTEENPAGGKGHCYFFVDKLLWLHSRYLNLITEIRRRGFKAENRWPDAISYGDYARLWNWYRPDIEDQALNVKRIVERSPKNPHYYSAKFPLDVLRYGEALINSCSKN